MLTDRHSAADSLGRQPVELRVKSLFRQESAEGGGEGGGGERGVQRVFVQAFRDHLCHIGKRSYSHQKPRTRQNSGTQHDLA